MARILEKKKKTKYQNFHYHFFWVQDDLKLFNITVIITILFNIFSNHYHRCYYYRCYYFSIFEKVKFLRESNGNNSLTVFPCHLFMDI